MDPRRLLPHRESRYRCREGQFYIGTLDGRLDGVGMKTGRPRTKPEARYQKATFNLAPDVHGAHGWQSNAFNPETGFVYIATQEASVNMGRLPNYKCSLTIYNVGINMLGPPPPGAKSRLIERVSLIGGGDAYASRSKV